MERIKEILCLAICIFSILPDICNGDKLERKQDFFESDTFDPKREYGLSEIGKRGFTPTYDYTSSEYGIASSTGVTTSSSTTPSRDLIPPAVSSEMFPSSTSPPTTRSSDYSEYSQIGSSSSTPKDFHSYRSSQITRRSPHLPISNSHFYDEDISTAAATHRGGSHNPGNYGLVADSEGKLIGYRGSILPGYPESVIASSSSIGPEQTNFIGGYYPGSAEYTKSKYGMASSPASNGAFTSTPIYYPGREEDHTYRIRDSTSQGYDDDETSQSSEDNDFNIGSSTYQPSPLSPPPHQYRNRDNDRYSLDSNLYSPYSSRDHSSSRFSYDSPSQGHNRLSMYDYHRRRSYRAPSSSSNYEGHGLSTVDRPPAPYSYSGISYNDYGSS